MTLRTLNYGNYGIFLIMGNAGFCPSTVVVILVPFLHSILTKGKFGGRGLQGLRLWGFTDSDEQILGGGGGGGVKVEAVSVQVCGMGGWEVHGEGHSN